MGSTRLEFARAPCFTNRWQKRRKSAKNEVSGVFGQLVEMAEICDLCFRGPRATNRNPLSGQLLSDCVGWESSLRIASIAMRASARYSS